MYPNYDITFGIDSQVFLAEMLHYMDQFPTEVADLFKRSNPKNDM